MRTLALGRTVRRDPGLGQLLPPRPRGAGGDVRRSLPPTRRPARRCCSPRGRRRARPSASVEGEPVYHASLAPEAYRRLLDEAGFEVLDWRPEDAETAGTAGGWRGSEAGEGGGSPGSAAPRSRGPGLRRGRRGMADRGNGSGVVGVADWRRSKPRRVARLAARMARGLRAGCRRSASVAWPGEALEERAAPRGASPSVTHAGRASRTAPAGPPRPAVAPRRDP